ncbi:MAG: hypothetical protein AB7T37_14900 [Dehalococcoidia bacterium]
MTPAGPGRRHELAASRTERRPLRARRTWIAKVSALVLGCLVVVGVALPASTHAQQPTHDQIVSFGTQVESLVNAHNVDGLVALFMPADITCPGPDPNATANVCQGQAPGTVVQGYWAGPLYSELGAVTGTGLRAEVNLGLDRVPAPVALATTAKQAMFPFLRDQCLDCGTVVLAGTVPPAGGQPTLSFSVKFTANGPRLFSITRGEILQPDERVYVTGGKHRDGTEFIRASQSPWPAPAGIALDTSVTITNPDGSFIPIDQRLATSVVFWQQLPGYTGVFEVERALVPYNSGQARAYTRIATVPAAPEPAMVGYPDTHLFTEDLQYQRCYRVRTVINGEGGPYSAELCTQAPPNTGPTEPPFNYDIVREVVVPLIGDDGRTHYVTLSEDTAGIVRLRLSLFDFAPGGYNVVLFRRGNCSATANYGPDDVIRPNFSLELLERAGLVLTFFNTDSITLTSGPKSIYDADGTSLAIYRPGSGGSGLRAACAVLSSPPDVPNTGSGTATPGESSLDWRTVAALAAGVALAGAAASMALRRGIVRR